MLFASDFYNFGRFFCLAINCSSFSRSNLLFTIFLKTRSSSLKIMTYRLYILKELKSYSDLCLQKHLNFFEIRNVDGKFFYFVKACFFGIFKSFSRSRFLIEKNVFLLIPVWKKEMFSASNAHSHSKQQFSKSFMWKFENICFERLPRGSTGSVTNLVWLILYFCCEAAEYQAI